MLDTTPQGGGVVNVISNAPADAPQRLANETEHGVSSAALGRDFTRAMAMARRIESDICHIEKPDRAGRGADAVRRHRRDRHPTGTVPDIAVPQPTTKAQGEKAT